MATMNDDQRNDLLEKLAFAIKNKDRLKFDELTQKGIVVFSEEQIQRCLNEELPLKLSNNDIQTLLKFMVNEEEDSYIDKDFYDINEIEEMYKNYNILNLCNMYVDGMKHDEELSLKLKSKLKQLYTQCAYNYDTDK